MAITAKRLQESMCLYEQEFGEIISEDDAREVASRLVELYQLLAAPLPSEVPRAGSPQTANQSARDHR